MEMKHGNETWKGNWCSGERLGCLEGAGGDAAMGRCWDGRGSRCSGMQHAGKEERRWREKASRRMGSGWELQGAVRDGARHGWHLGTPAPDSPPLLSTTHYDSSPGKALSAASSCHSLTGFPVPITRPSASASPTQPRSKQPRQQWVELERTHPCPTCRHRRARPCRWH